MVLPEWQAIPFAKGGSNRASQTAIARERGPRLFVPRTEGRIVAYGSRTQYQPRFYFYGSARRSVPRSWRVNWTGL